VRDRVLNVAVFVVNERAIIEPLAMARALTMGVAISVVLAASSVRAQAAPEPIRVAYTAFAQDCPDTETFWQRVLDRTAAERAGAGQPAPTFRVLVAPADAGVEAVLEVVEIDGSTTERTLVGRDCDEAVSAVALVVALAIEERAQERIEQAAIAVEPLDATVEPEPVIAVVPVGAPWRTRIGASFVLAAGRTPDALFGADLWVAIRQESASGTIVGPSFRVALGAAHAASISVNGERAQFDWVTARLDGCPISIALTPDSFLEPCAVVEGGALIGAGVGVADARTAARPWVAVGGSVRLSWRIAAGLGLELGVGVLAPLIRDRFFFASGVTILQVPEVSGIFDLGLSWTIP